MLKRYGLAALVLGLISTAAPVDAGSFEDAVRARWRGAWIVTEIEAYSPVSDIGAGGRIAFDPDGYVFISIGIKGGYFAGVQDLRTPYGKTHRVHDDGRIPSDNPFVDTPDAANTIWTYGHRSPQGLEYHPGRRQLWGTEMGPRGGDEVVRLARFSAHVRLGGLAGVPVRVMPGSRTWPSGPLVRAWDCASLAFSDRRASNL